MDRGVVRIAGRDDRWAGRSVWDAEEVFTTFGFKPIPTYRQP